MNTLAQIYARFFSAIVRNYRHNVQIWLWCILLGDSNDFYDPYRQPSRAPKVRFLLLLQ